MSQTYCYLLAFGFLLGCLLNIPNKHVTDIRSFVVSLILWPAIALLALLLWLVFIVLFIAGKIDRNGDK